MSSRKTFYITTPIYYANDRPHLGHAYTTVMADVFARYYRLALGPENVFFLTGTDEHGGKIEQSAAKAGLPPQIFVDSMSNLYRELWRELDISYDEFFRTSEPRHEIFVQDFLRSLYEQGLIYKKEYAGIYCLGCEKFLLNGEMAEGRCIQHPGLPLQMREEENYFFRLSAWQNLLKEELEEGHYTVLPEERRNEAMEKLREGICDISISRPGVFWGIPLPWDTSQTVYVWVDALLNYLSAIKAYEDRGNFWPPSLQLMAKDILWFHSVVWPGLLHAAGLPLPETILAHGFFTINGQKMSKTTGNVIDPADLIVEYGPDAVRYLLISAFPFGSDGDISVDKFKEKYNADLANGLGNLIGRIARLAEDIELCGQGSSVEPPLSLEICGNMARRRPDKALKSIWKVIDRLNEEIASDRPWKLEKEEKRKVVLAYVGRMLVIASDLRLFMPSTAVAIRRIFNEGKICKPEALFPRK